jgi:hypothetical protein
MKKTNRQLKKWRKKRARENDIKRGMNIGRNNNKKTGQMLVLTRQQGDWLQRIALWLKKHRGGTL